MNDLKPCPFCGGEAKTEQVERIHYGTAFRVGCSTDGCRGWWFESILYRIESKAIEAWNTRAERTCHITAFGLPLSDFPIGKCSNCGCGADVSSKYCWQCGAKVKQ